MIKFATKAAALSLLFALAGCGGEPSEDDIRQAMQPMFDGLNKEVSALASPRNRETVSQMMAKLESVKKHACAKENTGYRCDFSMTVKQGNKTESTTHSFRFTKGDKGWALVGQ